MTYFPRALRSSFAVTIMCGTVNAQTIVKRNQKKDFSILPDNQSPAATTKLPINAGVPGITAEKKAYTP